MVAPLCRDCKYREQKPLDEMMLCLHPKAQEVSVVTGKVDSKMCSTMRTLLSCGPEGKLFEPMPEAA